MNTADNKPVKRDSFGTSFGVLVALAGVDYIASKGLRVILALAQSILPKGGKLTAVNLTPPVRMVFDMSGFSSLFTL